ncbi:COG1470 family protein [Streptomyces lunaelactis]|uniref:COG1470 family protein n=1 Tax=Streptomyces lunaelactis TaxID=1535768 RepID=UPI001584917F|nr:hypothetical protein [Streptomyces lunaelactis]NUK58206.1 hypothetical protein [Streptomyces lunaelactis]
MRSVLPRLGPVRGLTATVAAFAALLLPPAARAADDPAWTAEPVAGGGRPYIYMEGVPGTVLEDKLSVTNRGARPLTVQLRAADAYNTEGGALAVRGARGSKTAGTWITLATARVTVPPRTRAEVPFSVTLPAGALPGDHPAAVMAASGGREAGVRIHLRVSGPTLAALTVEDVSVSGGSIHYALVNRGNTALTPRVSFRADGLLGEALRRAPRTPAVELLPGRRVSLAEKWANPPLLDAVNVHVRATAQGAAPSEATTTTTFVPWRTVVAVAAAMVAVAATATWLLRRRRHSPNHSEPPDTPEEPDRDRHLARSGA